MNEALSAGVQNGWITVVVGGDVLATAGSMVGVPDVPGAGAAAGIPDVLGPGGATAGVPDMPGAGAAAAAAAAAAAGATAGIPVAAETGTPAMAETWAAACVPAEVVAGSSCVDGGGGGEIAETAEIAKTGGDESKFSTFRDLDGCQLAISCTQTSRPLIP